jgi:hypothetical protein
MSLGLFLGFRLVGAVVPNRLWTIVQLELPGGQPVTSVKIKDSAIRDHRLVSTLDEDFKFES